MRNHLREGGEFDAVLHLLDRQVLDADGAMVCNVDDLELTQDDESLRVTGLLVGPAALLPRFSGGLGSHLVEYWRRLGKEQSGRTTPWRIDLDLVDKVDYAVHLSASGDGLLHKPENEDGTRRLDHLLGMSVLSEGTELGQVQDVRVGMRSGVLECRQLIVGRRRPGSMLGYDRSPDMGPVWLGRLIRWWHRDTGQIPLDSVTAWDWQGRRLQVRGGLNELTHS